MTVIQFMIHYIRLKHRQKIKESRYFSLQFHKPDRLLGSNAIIGIDIDIEVVGKDGSIMMISVSGTAVTLA